MSPPSLLILVNTVFFISILAVWNVHISEADHVIEVASVYDSAFTDFCTSTFTDYVRT